MNLYDAHNHLQDDRFAGRQDEILAACREGGIRGMVVNGSCEADWPAVAELARRHPDLVRPAFGYHPWYVHERSTHWLSVLRGFLRDTPGATIGEIGLDRWKPGLDFADQQAVFQEQLELAPEMDLPVTIHCLKAWGALAQHLENGPRLRRGFLLHSYGGSVEMIEIFARLDARFSLPGYFAHERKHRQRETFRHVPRDRLLIETDAPDQPLPPELVRFPLAGPEPSNPLNHPANLPAVYAFAADLLELPLADLADIVEANFTRFFAPTSQA